MHHPAILIPVLLIVPALAIRFLQGTKVGQIFSPVVACFVFGIAFGNFGWLKLEDQIFEPLAAVTILLAIPLLLMTTDFKSWLLRSRPALKAIAVACLGVALSIIVTKIALGYLQKDTNMILAMIGSCLIGSSANMSAVGIALKAEGTLFTLVTTSDVFCGALFFLYLVGIAPRLYRWILPSEPSAVFSHHTAEVDQSKSVLKWRQWAFWKDSAAAFAVAVLSGAVAAGFTYLITGELRDDVFLVALTLSGMASGMLSKKVRNLRTADMAGQYLLLVFSFAIGLRADFSAMLGDSQTVLIIVATAYALTAIFQLLLFWIFRISSDTAVMATAGTVFSPVFIGQVAVTLDNKQVILTGMVTAIMGYAIGNFVGLMIFQLLPLIS
jgi:uncharacterized membrane protein